MEKSIFSYIWKYSAKQQLWLLLVSVASFPFLYMSLDVPKTIVNKAISGKQFPQALLGFELDQTPYLMALCAAFIILVFINGGFKYFINIYQGTVAERMLRRLRFQLVERILRFPLRHFRKMSQGEIVSMIAIETESLGGFFGEAFVLPCFQGGILLTLISFMFVQDPILGAAAVILYPIQGYLIPKLQRRVNALGKERVKHVRKLTERIGEMVSGVSEIHAHDAAHYELADFSKRFGVIFFIREDIFRKKFFIKFLNNFLAQLTPFFFYSIGGYLVIKGDLTLGSLVAVLAAYKDILSPWKELLAYYQHMEDSKCKYLQIIEQFNPPGMFDENLHAPMLGPAEIINEKIVASNLSLEIEEGSKIIDGASFSLDISGHVAIVGSSAGGKSELAQAMARQILPASGKISIGGKNLATIPNSIIGRQFAYVDQEAYVRSGTIMDALLYGLKHYPVAGPALTADKSKDLEEAKLSGNSPFDIDAEWVDFQAINVKSHDDLVSRAISVLRIVEMENDVFQIALLQTVKAKDYPMLADGVLKARVIARRKLKEQGLANLVEVFDKDRFNANASVAENILFGAPLDKTFNIDTLGSNAYVLGILDKVGLTGDFLNIGHTIANLMVELFHGLAHGHEFFERFSFIDADDLPEFQRIANHVSAHGLHNLDEIDRAKLIDLPFKLIPSRHHLDLIDNDMKERILNARRMFSETLPDDLRAAIAFFDFESNNSASCIQDNILFGKISGAYGESASRIGDLLVEVIEELGLRNSILEVGLDFETGVAGKRLSLPQRQKLSIARCLMKNPRMLIYNQAATALDASSQNTILEKIKEEMKNSGLVWVGDDSDASSKFDHVLEVKQGKVIDIKKGEKTVQPSEAAPAPPLARSELDIEAGFLANIDIFKKMDRSRLKLLAFTADRMRFDEGQYLFMQGSMAEFAYIIIEGSVDVIVDTSEGSQTVATLRKGDLVGELALLCDAPRTASIRAKTPLTVLSISRDIFLKHVKEDRELGANLTRIIASRLAQMVSNVFVGEGLYDEITGLPNRKLLKDRIKLLSSMDKRTGSTSILIIVGMNELAEMEKAAGPISKSDRAKLLRGISLRIKSCLRDADTLAYMGKLGFGVIANGAGEPEKINMEPLIKRMTKVISEPFKIGDKSIHLKKKLDFKLYPLTEENFSVVLDIL